MIKILTKNLFYMIVLLVLAILYLSFVGIKTDKFNSEIVKKILKINQKIDVDLKEVKFLLDPFNFKTSIATENLTIILEGKKLEIKEIKTNLSLKALIKDEFLIDDLQILTKNIKLNDLVLFARSFNNSTELFFLNKFIKEGFFKADIKLKFDDNGKIKNDYLLTGFVKNTTFKTFNNFNLKNLDFKFNINKDKYSLTKIETKINNINLLSPLIEVVKESDLFLIKGKILTSKKNFNREELNTTFASLLENSNVKKARFSSENDISFNINKKLKFSNLNIQSKINLEQLVLKNNFFDLKLYLPNLEDVINFKNHKIEMNYDQNEIKIKGEGKVLTNDKFDSINYDIKKNKNKLTFITKLNLKNSKLLISLLDYEKKENLDASLSIKANLSENNKIKFDLISLTENNNKFSIKNLNLDKDFKIINLDSFNFKYRNNKKIENQLFLKKNNLNYSISGKNFDATKLINIIMDSEDDNISIFKNFNSKIKLAIEKTYINEIHFMNDLSGIINYKNSKIDSLNLRSTFSNNKELTFSIKTNNQKEKITKIITNYPKPLIKRYDFIKGFEEGYLEFFSVKKNGISNSVLIIDNFKLREVPVLAKLLSLASLQGIADLLTGEGIRFTDFEMNFSNQKGLTTIEEMYAIGPAVSILMDGYIQSKKLISLRGTLVPATTINRSIASLPLLGKILIGDKTGEGVFGVSFKIKGPPKDLKTTVNPIKTLTPRFITRTLEKIKKN
tara:strand:- start:633 stop:2831 length:2199 start_codon:yes stop_codon:yes gene_type:complete